MKLTSKFLDFLSMSLFTSSLFLLRFRSRTVTSSFPFSSTLTTLRLVPTSRASSSAISLDSRYFFSGLLLIVGGALADTIVPPSSPTPSRRARRSRRLSRFGFESSSLKHQMRKNHINVIP